MTNNCNLKTVSLGRQGLSISEDWNNEAIEIRDFKGSRIGEQKCDYRRKVMKDMGRDIFKSQAKVQGEERKFPVCDRSKNYIGIMTKWN